MISIRPPGVAMGRRTMTMVKRKHGAGRESTRRDTGPRAVLRSHVPRAAMAVIGLVGLGCAAAAGCGETAPLGGAGGSAAQERAIGESAQAVVSAQACLSLSRVGST